MSKTLAAAPSALAAMAAVQVTAGPVRNWSAERTALKHLAASKLKPYERLVLYAIEVHIAHHDEGWPTQKSLAAFTGISERQVRRCIEALERGAFLRIRVVPAGGVLPSGTTTDSVRLVYARGPRLLSFGAEASPPAPPALSVPRRLPPPAPVHRDAAAATHPDMVAATHPDTVAAKGSQILKQTNTPLPPSQAREPPRPTPQPRKCGLGSIRESSVKPEPERLADARDVLLHWRAVLWPDLRGSLETAKRIAVVLDRLVDGFTTEELRWAIDAASEHPWYREDGQRHRLLPEVLLGRAERVGELAKRGRELAEAQQRRATRLAEERQHRSSPSPSPPRVSIEQVTADLAKIFGRGPRSTPAQASDAPKADCTPGKFAISPCPELARERASRPVHG